MRAATGTNTPEQVDVTSTCYASLVGKRCTQPPAATGRSQRSCRPGSLLHPGQRAQRVGTANVRKTSQADRQTPLFGALGVMAAAQGTMNTFSFGDSPPTSTNETICGVAAPGRHWMEWGCRRLGPCRGHNEPNSRLTDPKSLRTAFRFAAWNRSALAGRGSGGQRAGGHAGTAGGRRGRPGGALATGWCGRSAFSSRMTAAILSGSRQVAPFGLAGWSWPAGRNRDRPMAASRSLGGSI